MIGVISDENGIFINENNEKKDMEKHLIYDFLSNEKSIFKYLFNEEDYLDDMNKALINRKFRLVYQPKFDAKTKQIVGAEALIRWTKQDNITVYPN